MSSEQKPQLSESEQQKRDQLQREKPRVFEKIAKFAEKVERGESIAILQFQYDYTCNFRCQHCSVTRFQGKKEGRCFTPEDVKELSRQADEMGLAQHRYHRRRAAGVSRLR